MGLTAGEWAQLEENIRRINAGMREIEAARKKAGVKPGEPLVGLHLPETETS